VACHQNAGSFHRCYQVPAHALVRLLCLA